MSMARKGGPVRTETKFGAAFLCGLAATHPALSQDDTAIARIAALGPAIGYCFAAPEGSAGSEVTLRFSLDKTGHLIGTPRVTYRHLVGPADRQRAFLDAASAALRSCTPLHLAPVFAAAIAGQPITVTFGAHRPLTRLQDS